jgi:hypothetical protein
MEAQEFFNAHREISESVKENILRGVWQHQTTKDKGFKVRLEREVLPAWVEINESLVANAAAMAAVKMVKNSSVSIFTAIDEIAKKKKIDPKEISKQIIKLYPEYEGTLRESLSEAYSQKGNKFLETLRKAGLNPFDADPQPGASHIMNVSFKHDVSDDEIKKFKDFMASKKQEVIDKGPDKDTRTGQKTINFWVISIKGNINRMVKSFSKDY